MSSTTRTAVGLMVLCTLFTSVGQLLWKKDGVGIDFSAPLTLFNLFFVLGFVSYGLGGILMVLAFQRGELSILYPIIATSYVWVSLLSHWIFPDDQMNGLKFIGVLIILASVSLLGWGGTRTGSEAV